MQLSICILCFRILCIRHFVINIINNIRIRFIITFYVICAVIYCSFCCIYVWLDPGTYMIARFMFFYKPGVTKFNPALWCIFCPSFYRHKLLAYFIKLHMFCLLKHGWIATPWFVMTIPWPPKLMSDFARTLIDIRTLRTLLIILFVL